MYKLIWSRYNFLVVANDTTKYLYNSYTNGLIKLDNDFFLDLKKISEQKESIEDLLSLLSEEEINYLKDNYILVEDDERLVEIMHHQSLSRLYSKKHIVLTIAPTQSCNFNCVYCFEHSRKSEGISDETEEAIIAYLTKNKEEDGLESIDLTWYGGEPLLQVKRLISMGTKINDLGLYISEQELITNGYFFTVEVVKKLIDIKVSCVQITLDGFKDTHDIRRPLLNGKGTFDTIIKNLDAFYNSEYKDLLTVAIRVNVDKRNYTKFIDIYNWLKSRYNSEKLIVYPGIIFLDETNTDSPICLSRNKVTDIFLDLYKRYNVITEELYPDDINVECLVRSPYSMLIGSKGEIYKCYEDLGNKDLIVGNINNDEIWSNHSLIAKYAVGIDHYQDKKCRECSYLPICRGGCPLRRLENKYMGKSNDCCTPFKGRIQDYIDLYSQITPRINFDTL